MGTGINWCDETINPIVGCSKISAGCQNCYAEKMANRLASMGFNQYLSVVDYGKINEWKEGFVGWNGTTAFVESELWKPHRCKKPRSIFISSMGDLFHDSVSIKWQLTILDMVCGCPQHTFIMLTKRPINMKLVIDAYAKKNGILPNLVLGVSVENQATANERIPVLLKTPAVKRFISVEPMIESVDLERGGWSFLRSLRPPPGNKNGWERGLDGVILGGESGHKARYMSPDWVRLVRDQCAAASVPFMFKQWDNCGGPNPYYDDNDFPLLDGRTHTDLAWGVHK